MSMAPPSSPPILYRATQFDSADDAAERTEAYAEFIEDMIESSSPHDIMDTLLMLANVCEASTYQNATTEHRRLWAYTLSSYLRQTLSVMTHLYPTAPRPEVLLEDPLFYHPRSPIQH